MTRNTLSRYFSILLLVLVACTWAGCGDGYNDQPEEAMETPGESVEEAAPANGAENGTGEVVMDSGGYGDGEGGEDAGGIDDDDDVTDDSPDKPEGGESQIH